MAARRGASGGRRPVGAQSLLFASHLFINSWFLFLNFFLFSLSLSLSLFSLLILISSSSSPSSSLSSSSRWNSWISFSPIDLFVLLQGERERERERLDDQFAELFPWKLWLISHWSGWMGQIYLHWPCPPDGGENCTCNEIPARPNLRIDLIEPSPIRSTIGNRIPSAKMAAETNWMMNYLFNPMESYAYNIIG